jgi:hypothetical protein
MNNFICGFNMICQHNKYGNYTLDNLARELMDRFCNSYDYFKRNKSGFIELLSWKGGIVKRNVELA